MRPAVQVENVAEIAWGALLIIYLIGAGRPEYLQWPVLTIFGLSAVAAMLELYLRRIQWRWLIAYDTVVWTLLISAMVCVTGGRGSEVWPAYFMMSLTAPSVGRSLYHYSLMAFNSLLYGLIFTLINPYGVEFNLSLLCLRIGLFFLVTYVVDRSMDRERNALQSLIQVANSRVNELVSARDNERRRIASDIHDWLGTGIVAPMRKLELAIRSADPAIGRAKVEETLQSLRRSHDEMRRVMENLHPHLLEQMGLTEALRAYVQQWGEESAIGTAFRGDTAPEPPPAVTLTVYRILQEALNNVAKHAAAEQVTVELTLRRASVALVVQDDGEGYDGPRTGGRGLAGMKERVAIFGGSLVIESLPGKGTAVRAYIPIAHHTTNQPEEVMQ